MTSFLGRLVLIESGKGPPVPFSKDISLFYYDPPPQFLVQFKEQENVPGGPARKIAEMAQ